MTLISILRSNSKLTTKNYITISRALYFSTETKIINEEQQKVPPISKKNDNLYRRISPVGDPKASMIPILEQWQNEGKTVRFDQLIVIIKSLRKFNRYTHALQLSEWMANKKPKLQPAGVAVHLDLISRVKGLEEAEKYFNSTPDDVKNLQVYGALLNCYAVTKSVEKAEATAEKMKQFGMMTTLSYNSMLNLYKKVGDNEKLDKVYQEMTEMGVRCDKPTYYIRLSSYAAACNIKKMEDVLENMEKNSDLNVDWNTYVIASGGYLKSGLLDKSFEMLKKAEALIRGNSKGAAWEILLRMYASLGKKDDVYRIWNLYKTSWRKVYNRGYSAMMHALTKVDDIEGAEKLLAEWESEKLSYDFRIVNMLINAFCNNGLLGKAEAYVDRIVDMGKRPPSSTWCIFVTAYVKKNEMDKAFEMVKKCVASEDKRGCRLSRDIFDSCVEYLEEKGSLGILEEFKKTFEGRIVVMQTSDDAESVGDEVDEGFDEIEGANR
ncbi:pentatricopeptide repeat-containing protein At2g20710, mitochondrial-like [Rutidosis leptorrhynchoides]|uniref:pentatricopeptide repeat-containing protein At2g20710, mitochondrial-like n=1 Tax=Rutidosis leptorrhynchoides TaxID=125765 RepID=UPI003A99113F